MFRTFKRILKSRTEHLNNGREVIGSLAHVYKQNMNSNVERVLDIGFGEGQDLETLSRIFQLKSQNVYGIEFFDRYLEIGKKNNWNVCRVNLENERLPFDDQLFDIVVANQVFEHMKEIFWITSEISRVLKIGGAAIIGVPNLAGLHNRFLLAIGKQPASINTLSDHVRGFTRSGFDQFITQSKIFTIEAFRGSNFYPFPETMAKLLSKALPNLSVAIFFLCIRTESDSQFLDGIRSRPLATNYFLGP